MNGDRSLSFLLPKSDANLHTFDMVEEESVVEYDGHEYRIKSLEERVIGTTPVKIVTAPHTFFDIVDEYRYTTLTNGFKSIAQVLSFIFDGTAWTFSVIDSFDTEEFENFGNANCLELFQQVLERYGAEFDINGNDVIIREKIGSVIDLQFRYNHNVKTLKKSLDTSNLSTYIKGTGKRNEDGTYVVEAEYTSPNATIFGIKHAPPYSNESITHLATLQRNIQRAIIDVPEVSIELEFVVLQDAGYTKSKPELGDIVPTIYEPLGDLNLDLRVMEKEEYPESKGKAPKVTLATVRKSLAQASFSYQKALLDKIYDANSGRLRYNVYDEAVKRATEALNNSLTELEYPAGMGIIARDPNDPNRFVALRSAGIGVTTDGGLTFKEAITSDGVTTSLLTAGQIKTNNIQIIGNDDLFYWDGTMLIAINATDPNKYVRLNSNGLYIAKGSMTIERPDGAIFMQDGMMRNDFSVDSHYPQFKNDNDVTIVDYWCRTPRDAYVDINYYSLYHNARYVKILVGLKGQSGNHAYFRFAEEGGGAEIETYEYRWENGPGYFKTLTLDLGIPTYTRRYFYAQLKSLDPARYAFGRILRIWMEG